MSENPARTRPAEDRLSPGADLASTSPAPPRRGARWPIGLLRVLSVVVLVQVLAQAALAGGFVTGDVSLLGWHSANGILLFLTSALLVVAAVLLVRPGRGPWWPITLTVTIWWLVILQVGFGFARLVGLHIPLGVALTGLLGGFTWWAFSHRARLSPRPSR